MWPRGAPRASTDALYRPDGLSMAHLTPPVGTDRDRASTLGSIVEVRTIDYWKMSSPFHDAAFGLKGRFTDLAARRPLISTDWHGRLQRRDPVSNPRRLIIPSHGARNNQTQERAFLSHQGGKGDHVSLSICLSPNQHPLQLAWTNPRRPPARPSISTRSGDKGPENSHPPPSASKRHRRQCRAATQEKDGSPWTPLSPHESCAACRRPRSTGTETVCPCPTVINAVFSNNDRLGRHGEIISSLRRPLSLSATGGPFSLFLFSSLSFSSSPGLTSLADSGRPPDPPRLPAIVSPRD